MARLRGSSFTGWALLYVILCVESVRASCYLPNGTDINLLFDTDDIWKACNAGKDSMCCKLNITSGADTCISNGLCHNNGDPTLWRESCTDPTWTSPACLQLCVSSKIKVTNSTNSRWPNGIEQRDAQVAITECDDGSFCCGQDNTDCCTKKQGLFIVNGKVQSTTATTTSASTSGTKTAHSGSASATTTSSSKGGGGSNAGAIAGGVVGGIAGLALVIGAILYFLKRRKQPAAKNSKLPPELDSVQRHEMSGLGQQPVKYAKVAPESPVEAPRVLEVPGTHEMAAH